jgi:hypothetical protein
MKKLIALLFVLVLAIGVFGVGSDFGPENQFIVPTIAGSKLVDTAPTSGPYYKYHAGQNGLFIVDFFKDSADKKPVRYRSNVNNWIEIESDSTKTVTNPVITGKKNAPARKPGLSSGSGGATKKAAELTKETKDYFAYDDKGVLQPTGTATVFKDKSGRVVKVQPEGFAAPVDLPEGVTFDESKFEPILSFGGQVQLPLTNSQTLIIVVKDKSATIIDSEDRILSRETPTTKQIFEFKGKEKKAKSSIITVKGTTTRIELEHKDGKNPIPVKLRTDDFYRAVAEAGVDKITPSMISGTTLTVNSFIGDRIVIRQVASGGYGLRKGNEYIVVKGNTITTYTGEKLDSAIDPKTGDLQMKTTAQGKPILNAPAGVYDVEIKTYKDGKLVSIDGSKIQSRPGQEALVLSSSQYDLTTGQVDYQLYKKGTNTIEIDSTLLTKIPFDKAKGIDGINGVGASDLKLAIDAQFGPNYPYYIDQQTGLIFAGGDWHEITAKGINVCGSSLSSACKGRTKAELDQIKNRILDPLQKARGLPSTSEMYWGSFLSNFKYYMTAYTGFSAYSSIFISEESLAEYRAQVNAVFCDMLKIGGSACWTSEICETYTDISAPPGGLVGSAPDGVPRSIAHIEGERSNAIEFSGASREDLRQLFGSRVIVVSGKRYNLSEGSDASLPGGTARVYKVTMSFIPQDTSSLQVSFRGERTVDYFSPAKAVNSLTPYSRTRSNPIVFISPTRYDTVCMVFNPPQENRNGRSVSELCVPLLEYEGGATAPQTGEIGPGDLAVPDTGGPATEGSII